LTLCAQLNQYLADLTFSINVIKAKFPPIGVAISDFSVKVRCCCFRCQLI
jgi:hypothetical protein